MFETLFGADVPPALRFFIAFLVVLALIGATAWFVRRFGAERFGGSATRGRQPRLAVIDASAVDGRRRLVLIRRDNVEHLLLIGGPTDVIVETNIVRAMGAPRDTPRETPPSRGAPVADPLNRPVPPGEGTMWPLQPQPELAPRSQRPAIAEEPAPWMPPPETVARPQRPADTLAGLAEELSSRPSPLRDPTSSGARPAPEPNRVPPPPAEPLHVPPGADQNLAEMAHRLEAALRAPSAARRGAEAPAEPEPKSPAAEPKPPRAEAKPGQSKNMYDSLEQEMASLLGRPGKP